MRWGAADRYLDLSRRGRTGVGHYLYGLCIVLFCWLILGGIISVGVLVASVGPELYASPEALNRALSGQAGGFSTYLALNLGFVCFFVGEWLAMRLALKRPLRSLVTPAAAVDWRRVALGFWLWVALAALGSVVEALLYPGRYQYVWEPSKWLPFALVVLLLTPIQTTAEELLFRGYLLQWFAGLTRQPLVLAGLSGLLFMLPHLGNPEMASDPVLMALNYFAVGFIFALVTLRAGTLELALGAHAGNNLYAGLVANYKNSALTTDSIFLVNELDPLFGLVSLIVSSAVFYAVVARTSANQG